MRSRATAWPLVGHSFGGLIAQRLLSDGVASATVAIGPAHDAGDDHGHHSGGDF